MLKYSQFAIAVVAALVLATGASVATAQNITEGFDDITTLPAAGWAEQNNSVPLGVQPYFQGNSAVFASQGGAANSYLGVNFNSGSGLSTISNWKIMPNRVLSNGDTLKFYTRTVDTPAYPDRLQVRMSLNGASTNVGSTATSVGDFTTLLLDINPTYSLSGYPNGWTQYSITLSGIGAPTSGRLAFRYFVENGGPSGANSDYIGIDTLAYTQAPEPAALALLGIGGLALIRRRR